MDLRLDIQPVIKNHVKREYSEDHKERVREYARKKQADKIVAYRRGPYKKKNNDTQ